MPRTEVRSAQIKDATVGRSDLDTATAGSAVVAKIVAGTGVSLSWTGADSGTGDVTVSATGSAANHHTTHEPGGTDALTALSAAILTTGTLADARLSPNVQLKPVNIAVGGDTTGTLRVGQGGTNITSYTVGDLLWASSLSVLSKLPIGGVGTFLRSTGSAPQWQTVVVGDVVGPPSSTDKAIACFNGATGKYLQDSTVTIDAGNLTVPTSLSIGTNPAQSGHCRLQNSGYIYWRNQANTADSSSIVSDNGYLYLISEATLILQNSAGYSLNLQGSIFHPATDNAIDLGYPGALRWKSVNVYQSVVIGINPASTGAIRLANNSTIFFRDGTNSGDIDALTVNASGSTILSCGVGGYLCLRSQWPDQLMLAATGFWPNVDAKVDLGQISQRYKDLHLSGNVNLMSDTGLLRFGAGNDVVLQRGAANILAQKNAANAQKFRLYGNATEYLELTAAPALQSTTIYAPGALHLGTGMQSRWYLTTGGHWNAASDNTYDFGATTSARPRSVYVGTSLAIGSNVSTVGFLRFAASGSVAHLVSRNAANTADVGILHHYSVDNKIYIGSVNDSGLYLRTGGNIELLANVLCSASIYERGRGTAMGSWVNVAFNAANFSGWTLASGDVYTNQYTLIGMTMIWSFFVITSSVPSATGTLYMTIPASQTILYHNPSRAAVVYVSGVPAEVKILYGSQTQLAIQRIDGANFAAGATVQIGFTIPLQVTT
jgi:hypothetical protein